MFGRLAPAADLNVSRGYMRVFPSVPAAIATGAVVLPVFIAGMQFLISAMRSGVVLLAVQLLWGIVAFFIPVTLSTMDLKYVRQRLREGAGDAFLPFSSRQDFEELYPTGFDADGSAGVLGRSQPNRAGTARAAHLSDATFVP